jgi:thymidine kinase
MNRLNHNAGCLELIVGCMYSGKSSSLISKIRQYNILGKKILVVNHILDERYSVNCVSSHDKSQVDAIALQQLTDIWQMSNYKELEVIFVEEAQFFSDLQEFVIRSVETDNKHVIVCGLDGDYNRKPFEQVINLIPFADTVEKKTALCIRCKDGTLASFSKRLVTNEARQLVGSHEAYIPVCRWHYQEKST